MKNPNSPQEVMIAAFSEALSALQEVRENIKKGVDRPADPFASKVKPDEFIADYQTTISDPAIFESKFLQAKAKYKTPADKPIPRKFLNYLKEGKRLTDQRGSAPAVSDRFAPY